MFKFGSNNSDLKKEIETLQNEITKLRVQCGNLRKSCLHLDAEIKEMRNAEPEEQKKLREFLREAAGCNINILVKHFKEMLSEDQKDEVDVSDS